MEVFSIFATLSLKDLFTGQLARIRAEMGTFEGGVASLGQRMGNLALAMAPMAIGAGAVLGAFGKCVYVAAGFEDQMAKVGAISRASASDLKALETRARELGASTQFTASEVAQAEQYLAMAGFTVQENLAALPGVLNLAAATSTDLGRAADIASDIMGAFGMQASEMTRVADALALTCAQANTDMEKLGDTMKYCAPVAKKAGLSLEETAAMAGLLGDVGIKGSQAGTTLKAMLNKMAAPTSEATKLLKNLGVTTKDAAGNLRSPIQVLGELTSKMKGMGSADQIAAMKKIVGEEAMAGFSELLNQADGAGKLMGKIENLLKGEGTAAEMAARQNDSLAGDMRGLGSAFESVQITIGKLFIPVLRKGVSGITAILRALDKFSQSKFGQAILKIVAALSAAIVAVTAFSAAMWALGKLGPMLSGMFGTIKAAMLGLGAPIWILIAAAGALYFIWKNDFGGIATVVARWGKNIRLIFEGVCAVFSSLKGASGEIRGELAREIKTNGLANVVTTIAKAIYRIREFFAGIWDGLNFDNVTTAIMPAILKIRDLFDSLGDAIGSIFGSSVNSAAKDARSLGEVIGNILGWSLESLAAIIRTVVNGIDSFISAIRGVWALLTGDFATAAEMGRRIWQNFCDTLMAAADLFRVHEILENVFNDITSFLVNLDLAAAFRQAWDNVVQFISGINLFESGAKLIRTLIDGILSAAGSLIESVTGVFSKLRNLLPFSDAKEGPLSELTLSGSRIMSTLGEGVMQGRDSLIQSVQGALGEVDNNLNA